MNIPLQFNCPSCRAAWSQRVLLSAPKLDFTCAECGQTWYGIRGLDLTVGLLILARSWHELEFEKDYDMAIVLAAAALDCELSWLYSKWKKFEALGADTAFSPEACEEELRRMRKVADKIREVSRMLYQGGIEQFVVDSGSWKETINGRFPGLHLGSLATDFQETVFRPRNRVLHQGKADHTRDDAAKCYSIAELGIRILKDMDKARFTQEDKDEQAHE